MDNPPKGREVICPACNEAATAIIPANGEIVEEEERSDGKVRVNCRECGEQFLAFYRTDTEEG